MATVSNTNVSFYLDLLASTGGPYPQRNDSVGELTVTWKGADLNVTVAHASAGRYTLILENAVLTDVNAPEDGVAGAADDEWMRSVIANGTWSQDGNRITVTNENVLGRFQIAIGTTGITVETGEPGPDDGSCRVCGSVDFSLKGFGSMPVRVTGVNEFVSAGAAHLKWRNTPAQLRCSTCQTAHPLTASRGLFTLDGTPSRT